MYQICEPKSIYTYCICPCGKGSIEREREITNIEDNGWLAPSRKVSYNVKCEHCKSNLTYAQLTGFNYNLTEDPFDKEGYMASDFDIPQYSSCYKYDYLGKHHHTLFVKEQLPDIVKKGITHKQYKCICERCGEEYIALDTDLTIFYVKSSDYFKNTFYCMKCWHDDPNKKEKLDVSTFEWATMQVLRNHNIDFISEYELPLGREGHHLRLDFYIPLEDKTYAIECQGEQHYIPVERFGGERYLENIRENDRQKSIYCFENDIWLVTIPWRLRNMHQIERILRGVGLIREG